MAAPKTATKTVKKVVAKPATVAMPAKKTPSPVRATVQEPEKVAVAAKKAVTTLTADDLPNIDIQTFNIEKKAVGTKTEYHDLMVGMKGEDGEFIMWGGKSKNPRSIDLVLPSGVKIVQGIKKDQKESGYVKYNARIVFDRENPEHVAFVDAYDTYIDNRMTELYVENKMKIGMPSQNTKNINIDNLGDNYKRSLYRPFSEGTFEEDMSRPRGMYVTFYDYSDFNAQKGKANTFGGKTELFTMVEKGGKIMAQSLNFKRPDLASKQLTLDEAVISISRLRWTKSAIVVPVNLKSALVTDMVHASMESEAERKAQALIANNPALALRIAQRMQEQLNEEEAVEEDDSGPVADAMVEEEDDTPVHGYEDEE